MSEKLTEEHLNLIGSMINPLRRYIRNPENSNLVGDIVTLLKKLSRALA